MSNLRTDSSFSAEGDHEVSEEEGEKRADVSKGDDVELKAQRTMVQETKMTKVLSVVTCSW